jgi:hypothetical protein
VSPNKTLISDELLVDRRLRQQQPEAGHDVAGRLESSIHIFVFTKLFPTGNINMCEFVIIFITFSTLLPVGAHGFDLFIYNFRHLASHLFRLRKKRICT